MRENRFSIGLAPGRVSGFYACKYYNKFVEYAAIGAVGVYTAADPYLQIVRNGENGLLCENTQAAWRDGIVRLISDPALRTRCAAEAVSQIRKEFNPASVAEEILRQCPELTGYHAPEVEAKSIRLPNRTIVYYGARAMVVFREKGIAGCGEILRRALGKWRKRKSSH